MTGRVAVLKAYGGDFEQRPLADALAFLRRSVARLREAEGLRLTRAAVSMADGGGGAP